jgi:hypothetical protein
VFRFLVLAFAAIFKPRALLLRKIFVCAGMLVLQRRHPRPRLSNTDRRWRNSLLVWPKY